QLIVNFARIYALKHNVSETNTMNRLYQLNRSGELTDSSFREMEEVYDYLMRTRFRHQVEAIKNNTKPDNDINPKELTELEQHMLKYIFSQINNFQKKLSFDFTGSA
ncbi:MAG: cyclic nucleotide-binding protein, partial [Candidatus Aminicenantes bacterium]|nr:cyclic nucleotide-binding protein [Candidatus Aminicenantes bacterium]